MDGGSPINIRYLDTFTRLGLPQSIVEHSNCTFHGIVPGRKAYSLGKVFLPVTFHDQAAAENLLDGQANHGRWRSCALQRLEGDKGLDTERGARLQSMGD